MLDWMERAKHNRYVILYSGDVSQIDNGLKEYLKIENQEQTGICYGVLDNSDLSRRLYSGNGKFLYKIGDFLCEINSLDGYKIRMKSEDIIKKDTGFCLVVFDREIQAVVDSIVVINGQINR